MYSMYQYLLGTGSVIIPAGICTYNWFRYRRQKRERTLEGLPDFELFDIDNVGQAP